jgi:F-type H+-transporting ATPase subunit b
MIEESRAKASQEADKIIAMARQNIKNEKDAAIEQIKTQVALLSVDIAEKILEQELSSKDSQNELIENYLKELRIN